MDYKNLNLKIGLECHQQLSGEKLFCSCNTNLKEENEEIQIKRKIRAVAGEAGEKDTAALYEEARDRTFVYHGYKDEYCLVECDDEPIHKINQEALKTALGVAKLLKLKIPKKVKVMRKIISDGSCVSGFQRLFICGTESKNSYIKTSQGKVKVNLLSLEEDACKIIKTEENKVHYSLSRVGIPLLELATNSNIKTPKQARETAETIGMIFRSFPLTRRGLGTIRQDINLSIKNGSRVELKGFQNIRQMPKVIEKEIERQLALVKQGKKVPEEVRKVEPDNTTTFLRPLPGKARYYPETDHLETTIPKQLLKQIKLPELIIEKSLSLEKSYNISSELAKGIIENKIDLKKLTKTYPRISPNLIAHILIESPKEIKSRFNIDKKLKESDLKFIFEALNQNKITKEAVIEIALDLLKNKKVSLEDYKQIPEKEIEKEIENIVAKNPGASINALMGILMGKFKGKIEGKKLVEIIKKFISF